MLYFSGVFILTMLVFLVGWGVYKFIQKEYNIENAINNPDLKKEDKTLTPYF